MPNSADSLRVPSYRRHKPSGQAVVTLSGRDIYLGKWNTKASRVEYDRLIGEWLASGRCLPAVPGGVSVAELALAYWRHARAYYRKDGKLTGSIDRIRVAVRTLRQTYGKTLAPDFGPLALQAVQRRLAESGKSRRYVNYLVDTIRRIFKWGVSQEMVPETAYRALMTVAGLRKGHTIARDLPPVTPISDQVVDATLPHLPEIVADMVRLQRLTGCRPAEVCILRPMDVDTAAEVWVYRPESHKTEHHGRERVICIGPKGQDVLRLYLLRPANSYCFAPSDSERRRLAGRHERRQVPLHYGNRPGTNRKRKPKRRAGDRYDANSYCRAVQRAVTLVNRKRLEEAKREGIDVADVELLPKWSPNRLRHTAATEIRRHFGLEAAQVTLGHASADVSQIYAERDLTLAVEIMRKIG